MTDLVLLLLLLTNTASFLLMGEDKRRAQRGKWRSPERTLFLSAALFGGLGGVLGMHIFHHKTRHLRFRLGFPALLLVQVVLVGLWAWQQLGR